MAAEYAPRDSLWGLLRQYLGYGEFRARTYKHHPHSMRRSHLLAPAVVAVIGASIVAPAGPKRLARGCLGVYGAALVGAGSRSLRAADPSRDALLVPLVLLAMHLAHGLGQMRGWIKYGPPLAALGAVCGREGRLGGWHSTKDRVWAPSLWSTDMRSDA
jgi:succinoglycan biosynthesis protein ExoA